MGQNKISVVKVCWNRRDLAGHWEIKEATEGHEQVIKRKVALAYKVRERDEEQERGFSHCLFLRVWCSSQMPPQALWDQSAKLLKLPNRRW